ncbi:MAG: shikimate kinase [Lachnospiraceae bacterium]|nr:shikimate kinase [Lachnospiraceae bacterium]
MSRIILEGFMGGGKSTYGRVLSKEFLLPFVDTDKEIEKKEGMSISSIFEEKGEGCFRDLETEYLRILSTSDICKDGVVSLGGGMPVREENRILMKKSGIVVYIRGSRDLLKERLKGRSDKRPLLKGENVEEKVDRLMDEREELYIDAADCIVDIDGKEIYEVVNELKRIYNRGKKGK